MFGLLLSGIFVALVAVGVVDIIVGGYSAWYYPIIVFIGTVYATYGVLAIYIGRR